LILNLYFIYTVVEMPLRHICT